MKGYRMELLIAVLVWLGLLAPGQQVTNTQFNELLSDNSESIGRIVNDTSTSSQAVAAYSGSPEVVIIDPTLP
jgi:hypothetical protein